jgi:hypothetical protein
MAPAEEKAISMPEVNSGISAAESGTAPAASSAMPLRDVPPGSTLDRRGFRRKDREPVGASCPPAPWPHNGTASTSGGPSTSLPGRRFRGWTKSALLAGESAAAGDGCCLRLPCGPAGMINEAIAGAGDWRAAVRHLSHAILATARGVDEFLRRKQLDKPDMCHVFLRRRFALQLGWPGGCATTTRADGQSSFRNTTAQGRRKE